jgi:hypothetical protein
VRASFAPRWGGRIWQKTMGSQSLGPATNMRRRTLIGSNSDGRHIDPSGGGAWPLRATNLGRRTRGGFHSFDYAPLPPKGAHRRWASLVGGRSDCFVEYGPALWYIRTPCPLATSIVPCGRVGLEIRVLKEHGGLQRVTGPWALVLGLFVCPVLSPIQNIFE